MMAGPTNNGMRTAADLVLPGMLPADGGLATASDAEERLVRAVSRYWAIQAVQVRDFGAGIGGVTAFRQRELGGKVLRTHEVNPWVKHFETKSEQPSWWLSGVSLDEGDFEQHEDGTVSIRKRFHVQWQDNGLPS